MLASRWPEPFVDAQWAYELKWDGVRALFSWDGTRAIVRSRAGNDATARYPELRAPAGAMPIVLDGEIVAFDETGTPSFELLQQRMNLASPSLVAEAVTSVPISYVVFDILFAGEPLLDVAIEDRLDRLDGIDLDPPMVRSQTLRGDPSPLWDFVRERSLEGVVAKRLGSIYRPGHRSADWRKITMFRQLRAVVGGFTEGEGGRRGSFGSLLLGLWHEGRLRWIGAVGSGFGDRALAAIRAALDEMATDESPFVGAPAVPGRVTFVAPRLVALVQYKEWTTAGRLRAPSFKGFTDDDVASVTWEDEGPPSAG